MLLHPRALRLHPGCDKCPHAYQQRNSTIPLEFLEKPLQPGNWSRAAVFI
jgi:hypothetical protein